MQSPSSTTKRAFLLLTYAAWFAPFFGCSPEKKTDPLSPSLRQLMVTRPCERAQRVVKGSIGVATLRVNLVDAYQQTISPTQLKSGLFPFTVKDNFSIRQHNIRIYDSSTGLLDRDAVVELELLPEEEGWLQENPNYTRLLAKNPSQQVPQAIALLMDMSDGAAQQDKSTLRISQAKNWMLSAIEYREIEKKNPDAVAYIELKNNTYKDTQNLFLDAPPEQQVTGSAQQPFGFLKGSGLRSALEKLPPSPPEEGVPLPTAFHAPVYETIQKTAGFLQEVRKQGTPAQESYNPGLFAVLLSEDVSNIDAGLPDLSSQARSALAGKDGNFIPFMGLVAMYPKTIKTETWESYLDKLCDLARAGTKDGAPYFGNIFRFYPEVEGVYNSSLYEQLKAAQHAMKGWIELKIRYSLFVTNPSKRHTISFFLEGNLGDGKASHLVSLEVQP